MNAYQPKLKFWRKGTIKRLFLGLFVVALVISAVGFITVAYLSKDLPNPDRLKEREVVQSTRIYDRTGKVLLYDIHNLKKRTLIALEEIPAYVEWAALAAEDANFWQHEGFDIWGILRSVWVDLKAGKKAQGGSTITQQLVKNAILSPEKTFSRKIKEIILAWEIEQKFSKKEILQMYLNEIPYGSNIYGIEAAAQSFFNKSTSDLSISEAALLASLPRAPTYYSPYGPNKDKLMDRHAWVLDGLYKQGYISEEEYQEAKNQKLFFASPNPIKAPHLVMYVKEQLIEKYGERVVEERGLKVTTTLDMKLQEAAEKIIREESANNAVNHQAKNAALVALDPRSGEILALVGSRDYFDLQNDGNVNVATRPRQPGSSIKPLVYATAFKKGYTPNTIIFDLQTDFDARENEEYIPENYNGQFRGPVTFREALAMSLNVPSVKVLYLAGVKDSIATASDLGISTLTDPNRYGLSLVLGGGEVTLLEETSAYSAFANDGIYFPENAILKVEDSQGKILEEFKPRGKRVLDQQIARLINDVLSDNEARAPMFGPNSNLYLGARPVAAKTGTTTEYRDAWTVGYTPQLAVGVWVGNNNNAAMENIASGGRVAGPIWNKFMKIALNGKPIIDFTPPEPTVEPINQGAKVKIDKITGKLATDLTPPHLVEEKIFQEVHSILYYINPQDPQFPAWEAPVLAWAKEHSYNLVIPTEYDGIHTLNNQPKVTIQNLIKNSDSIEVAVTVQSNLTTKQVDFFFDNALIKSDFATPYSAYFTIPSLVPGEHLLKVRAYDAVDNLGEATRTITLP